MQRINRTYTRASGWMLAAGTIMASTPHAVRAETLPRDDKNTYGKLDNGVAYIIRPTANPPGRIALFLHVRTGALNESETQNGLAHFLEHMAFNGSKNYPPGELVPYLNRMGMQFGADTNAHTNHHETVYKLFMPDTRSETIDKALTIFADDAGGLLLTQKEIHAERGVILEESRSRKSAGERLGKEMMRKVFAGTQIANHDVIGDEAQIAKFPRSEFEDYWNTWYRPENLTLIIVGDIKPESIIDPIKSHFAGLKARTPAREPRKTGLKPVNQTRAFVLTDPEQAAGQFEMMVIRAGRPPVTTVEEFHRNESEDIGHWIVRRRFEDLESKGAAAFRSAAVDVSGMQHEALLSTATASGEPADWNRMLDQVIAEVVRAIEHGFSDQELDLARTSIRANAQRAVETESTQEARAIINRLSGAVGQRSPLMSAGQRLALIERVLKDVSAEAVHQSFVGNFKANDYTYVLRMPRDKKGLTLPTPDEVLAAAKAAWARTTAAVEATLAATTILPTPPKHGKVASQTTDPDLKVTTVAFANGVRLHHRFMDYQKDQVSVSIVLPGGSIEETPDNHGISAAAGVALRRPATSRLGSSQLRDLMTGWKIRIRGQIGLDALNISVEGAPRELAKGLELVHALLTDAKIEPAAFDNWKKNTLQRLEQSRTDSRAQLRKAMEGPFYGDDPRFVELTPQAIDRLDAEKAQAWFRHIAGAAAIEVAIVGDIALDDAVKSVGQFLGSLPDRSLGGAGLESLRKIKRDPGPFAKTVRFESVTPKALVSAGFLGCEERDVQDRRLLTVAARILSDRMVERIREKEQLVYSIRCNSQPGNAIPGLGQFTAGAPTDPHNAEKLADTVIAMMREFAASGPTESELATAKKQIATSMETQLKEPRFWLRELSELDYRGRSLAELRELPGVFQGFTVKQVQDAFRKYAKDDGEIRFVVIPEKP